VSTNHEKVDMCFFNGGKHMKNNNFSKELKAMRKSYGISQNQLATAVGITRQYLNEIENEKAVPKEKLKESKEWL